MTATTTAPAALVPPPPRLALPYGMFSVLTFRDTGTGRWQMGATWESLPCTPVHGRGPDTCDPETPPVGIPKTLETGNLVSDASPFTIYGDFTCGPTSWSPQAAQDRAAEHLAAREEAAVEAAVWTGELGNTPNLSGANGYSAPVDLGTLAPADALAVAEDFLATEYGSLGVLHMSRGVAVGLTGPAGPILAAVGRLTTTVGTPVVAGAGYGSDRIVATPALLGYRSEVFTSSATPGDLLDRSRNDLYAVAERSYLVGWDDCPVGAATLAE